MPSATHPPAAAAATTSFSSPSLHFSNTSTPTSNSSTPNPSFNGPTAAAARNRSSPSVAQPRSTATSPQAAIATALSTTPIAASPPPPPPPTSPTLHSLSKTNLSLPQRQRASQQETIEPEPELHHEPLSSKTLIASRNRVWCLSACHRSDGLVQWNPAELLVPASNNHEILAIHTFIQRNTQPILALLKVHSFTHVSETVRI